MNTIPFFIFSFVILYFYDRIRDRKNRMQHIKQEIVKIQKDTKN